MTHYTRSQWRARPRRSNPGQMAASEVDGLALHWPAMKKPLATVSRVMSALRGWQDFHMDSRGWSDVAYQRAVDQDGNTYDLRGYRTRSGANGNTILNRRFGALLLILAEGEEPSPAMIAAVRDEVAAHRALFPRSTRIVGHGDIRPGGTACPGPAVNRLIASGAFEPDQEDQMTPAQEAKLDRALALIDRLPADTWRYRNADVTTRQAYSHLLDVTRLRGEVAALAGMVETMGQATGLDPEQARAVLTERVDAWLNRITIADEEG